MAASFETPGKRYHRPPALCLRSFPASRALQKQLHLCTSRLTALTQTKQDSPPRLSQEPSAPKAPPAPRTAASQHGGDSLTTRGSLLRGKHYSPKSNNGGPHENARRPRAPDICKSPCDKPKATCPRRSPRRGTRLAGTPLLFKVRVLKATTKLTPDPPSLGNMQECYKPKTTCNHAEAPGLHSSCRNPTELFKVRVLKESNRNKRNSGWTRAED